MSEMIGRVARAIDAAEMAWKSRNGGDAASCIDCPDDVKARAAIAAMREPTDAMITAADGITDDPFQVTRLTYQAMIGEALRT